MTPIEAIIFASFVTGGVAITILWVRYVFRTKWKKTPAGWTMFGLLTVLQVVYLRAVVVLLWPDWFKSGTVGEIVRAVIGWLLAGALWRLLWLFNTAQRAGRLNEQDALEGLETARQFISDLPADGTSGAAGDGTERPA